jgi:hypothetical protein
MGECESAPRTYAVGLVLAQLGWVAAWVLWVPALVLSLIVWPILLRNRSQGPATVGALTRLLMALLVSTAGPIAWFAWSREQDGGQMAE